jgi:ABC-type multidrug transport system fused ATPase/permease subunit
MCLSIPLWFGIIMLIERRRAEGTATAAASPSSGDAALQDPHAVNLEDDDVKLERQRLRQQVVSATVAKDGLLVAGLRKVFPGRSAGTSTSGSGSSGPAVPPGVLLLQRAGRALAAWLQAHGAGVERPQTGTITIINTSSAFTSGSPPPKVAVADLWLSVPSGKPCPSILIVYDQGNIRVAGECFGLLGPNGAGKTTALSMLVAETQPTAGTAALFGLPLRGQRGRHALDLIGYCPQVRQIR